MTTQQPTNNPLDHAPVDVLAVMDDAIVVLKSAQLGANSESIGGVTVESVQAACGRIAGRLEHVEAARAAIADLIDAAAPVAASLIARIDADNAMTPQAVMVRRLVDALARVGGGK